MLAQAARECDGSFDIISEPEKGTTVKASFRHSHPDRKPLGDVAETISTIMAGKPELELKYEHWIDGSVYRFDTRDLKRADA